MTTTRALPGIRFETEPAAVPGALPRMDIAAFVGYAERGPLDTPVPVEDVARFRDLFGSDAVLGRGADGLEHRAYLGPAVEGFFANGGRRCWVVRVAGTDAKKNTFTLPGLARVDNDGSLAPATAAARSEGSWSDDLAVSTLQRRSRLRVAALEFGGSPMVYVLHLRGSAELLAPGDVIDVLVAEENFGLMLVVESVSATDAGVAVQSETVFWFELSSGGSPSDGDDANLRTQLPQVLGEQRLAALSPAPNLLGSLIRFDLLVWRDDELEGRVSDLAFSSSHPRYWAILPDDKTLFARSDGRAHREPPAQALLPEITDPRFPLQGPIDPYAETRPQFLPWNMPVVASVDQALPAEVPAGSDLERDGVAILEAAHFLDRRNINRASMSSVLSEAEHQYYRLRKPLHGIYSLLPVGEVATIAVPDAQQLVQHDRPTRPDDPLTAPILEPPTGPDSRGRYRLEWTSVTGASGYRLERSNSTDFTEAEILYDGAATSSRFLPAHDCPSPQYWQVRANLFELAGPWSNTRVRILPRSDFRACGTIDPSTLEILLSAPTAAPDDKLDLSWLLETSLHAGDARYVVEVASDAVFANLLHTETVSGASVTVDRPSSGIRYYRVRASVGGVHGPWSNTHHWLAFNLSSSVPESPHLDLDVAAEMLAVQCALIRWCAARRDVMAVLTLPAGSTLDQARDHLYVLAPFVFGGGDGFGELAADVVTLAPGEAEALSFAAMYYPWLIRTRDRDPGGAAVELEPAPPEGSVCGSYATTALERGAWVAPANSALAGALALRPELDLPDWQAYRNARVNVVRRDRGVFLAMDATTLGTNEATRPINVRRLLMLLRRLAIREGQNEVFQPNSIDFRNRVRHRFERLMQEMFQRGAFSGRTPAEAFRVVADDSVNPPQSVDAGRFIVELHVAPSRPLEFLTVRLVQTGPEQLLLEGA